MTDDRIPRRTLLAGVSVALAGCIGDDDQADRRDDQENVDDLDRKTISGVEVEISNILLSDRLETPEYEVLNYDQFYVFIEIKTENKSDETERMPGAEHFKLISGSNQIDPIRVDEDEILEPANGPFLESDDARPDVEKNGWVGFPIEKRREDLRLSWSRGGRPGEPDEEKITEWDLSVNWSEVPDLFLESVEIFDAIRHEPLEVELEVKNEGGPGQYVDRIVAKEEREYLGGEFFDETISFKVGSGETQTESVTIPFEATEITLELLSWEDTVRYETPTLSWGESFAAPNGIEIVVEPLLSTDSIETDTHLDPETTSESGYNLGIFELEFKALDEGVETPRRGDFSIVDPESANDVEIFNEIIDPINILPLDMFGISLEKESSSRFAHVVEIPESETLGETTLFLDISQLGSPDIKAKWG